MNIPIIVPKAGLTMADATIERWLVSPGTSVRRGDLIAELTTEKVIVEVVSPEDGVIERLLFAEGDVVRVGEAIAMLVPASGRDTASDPEPVRGVETPSPASSEWDCVVIGGGPGGYVAALRIAQLGGRVALVERDRIGGTCLNRGCIPSKALLRAAELVKAFESAAAYGIMADVRGVNIDQAYARKDTVVDRMRLGVTQLLRTSGVTIYTGEAELLDPHTVRIVGLENDQCLSARNVIIATGSRPSSLMIHGASDGDLCTSDELLTTPALPRSLVIIGGGYIGMEFASLYSILGTKVTVVESEDRILPSLDRELAGAFENILRRDGVDIRTDCRVLRIGRSNTDKVVVVSAGTGEDQIRADFILNATGRVPVLPNLGELHALLVKNGAIYVDERMRTTVSNIYAIGDVTGGVQLAHVASAQGLVAADQVMGVDRQYTPRAVPAGIYTLPEIAYVGFTEEQVKAQGIDYMVGKFPFNANGKALASGETEGFVKVIVGRTYEEILGVHVLGAGAVSLIAEATLAVAMEATADELIEILHAHPSLPEILPESLMVALGRPLHVQRANL